MSYRAGASVEYAGEDATPVLLVLSGRDRPRRLHPRRGNVDRLRDYAVSFYAEARYHYIWGPDLKNAAGESQGKANGQFLPITFGFRF